MPGIGSSRIRDRRRACCTKTSESGCEFQNGWGRAPKVSLDSTCRSNESGASQACPVLERRNPTAVSALSGFQVRVNPDAPTRSLVRELCREPDRQEFGIAGRACCKDQRVRMRVSKGGGGPKMSLDSTCRSHESGASQAVPGRLREAQVASAQHWCSCRHAPMQAIHLLLSCRLGVKGCGKYRDVLDGIQSTLQSRV